VGRLGAASLAAISSCSSFSRSKRAAAYPFAIVVTSLRIVKQRSLLLMSWREQLMHRIILVRGRCCSSSLIESVDCITTLNLFVVFLLENVDFFTQFMDIADDKILAIVVPILKKLMYKNNITHV
jgi:hypothetical protein